MPIDKFPFTNFTCYSKMNPKCKSFILTSLRFILIDLNDATKKKAKLLVFNKEAHKLISNLNM